MSKGIDDNQQKEVEVAETTHGEPAANMALVEGANKHAMKPIFYVIKQDVHNLHPKL